MLKLVILLLGMLLISPVFAETEQSVVQEPSVAELAVSVLELGLGDGAFIIGSYLTADQIARAEGNFLTDTYPGTIKFADGDVVVVVDEKTRLVLAIYQRRENARADDVKNMVGHLMTNFGDPTTMAHEKLIYWAFGKAGKVDEDTYNDAKAVGKIDILATVKFSSTFEVSPGMTNENSEETGTIYYIITSDRLLSRYVTNP